MVNPDLQNYINSAKQQGLTDEQIRQNLLAQGWKEQDINMAFHNKNRNLSKLEKNTLRVMGVIALIPVLGILKTGHAGDQAGLAYYIVLVILLIIIGLVVAHKLISRPEKISKIITYSILSIVGLIDLIIVVSIVTNLLGIY